MQLTDNGLKDRAAWEEKGYSLPQYDRSKMRAASKVHPVWIHFGGGNIFRAFQAKAMDNLLNDGTMQSGIYVVASSDKNVVENVYQAHNDLCILVTLKSTGEMEKSVIGSMAGTYAMDLTDAREERHLKRIMRSASLKLATFTITEKGYQVKNSDGSLKDSVKADIEAGPDHAKTYLGKVAALLYARFMGGAIPLALVSMDNMSHNGDQLREAIHTYAEGWVMNGTARWGFLDYVEDPKKLSFPWSMIDKITPRPSESTKALIEADGIEGLEPYVTERGSHYAAYVNAEETEYLVIEDDFPNGRPPLEKAGFIFTDRETVDMCEKMKVCCCLNPLHTALAVFGCLLDYHLIADEMKDADLVGLIKGLGYKEGLPVVKNPGILDPGEFIETCLKVRFPNPFLPDTPQRIATDTSQKLAIRYGETVKAYIEKGMDVDSLELIPLVYAGWLRYLLAIDDNGNPFTPSPDPLLAETQEALKGLKFGEVTEDAAREAILPILAKEKIFGYDVTKTALAEKVIKAFTAMATAPGAVRAAIQDAIK